MFEEQRPRLFGVAYRMLGSAVEAEDVVQDAFLRWHKADRVEVPAAWLTKVVTNLCLNRLASARVTRERYVGAWLPEPVLTAGGVLGPLETVEQRDLVSLGFLVVLERLSPPERAVFVLREAFGHPHREIAEILDVDEAHSRQLHSRARKHIAETRRRFAADQGQHRRIVDRFLAATLDGDMAGLERLLADDVVSWADGGGTTTAARRPIVGKTKVLRYLLGFHARPEATLVAAEVAEVNGQPAALVRFGDGLAAVFAPEIQDGLVVALRLVVSPAKLAYADTQAK
ncbi:RNA polymerase sigma-70 factor (ECF subfamily) [Actinocrispum wychmicini]|uniref:RNA polymerase sigma-70 factor (ECF subfamily) n=1 Tax=Actinocrispum wychmicini TaxID=1213861 RepID=A0A4R2J9M1_9PSEU|nr:RNA polymerase sigma-70 factor (ECF subfamily) [Actinocrispum wychmicini]